MLPLPLIFDHFHRIENGVFIEDQVNAKAWKAVAGFPSRTMRQFRQFAFGELGQEANGKNTPMICARVLIKKTDDPARYPLELENGGFLLALERHGRFGEKFEAGSVNVVTFTYKKAHLDSDSLKKLTLKFKPCYLSNACQNLSIVMVVKIASLPS